MERSEGISLRNIVISLVLSGLGLAAVLYVTYEPGALRAVRQTVNPAWLSVAGIAVVLRVYLGAARLRYVSHGHLAFGGAVRGQLAWDFFSNVTPSVIGGGPLAAYFVSRNHGLKLGDATGIFLYSMLLDQVFFATLVPVLLISAVFIPVFPPSIGTVGTATFVLYFIGLLSWAAFFAYATLIRPRVLERFLERVFRLPFLRRFQDRLDRELTALRRRATLLRGQPPGFFLKSFGLTAASWLSRYALVVVIILSVEPALDVVLATLRSAAMTLGALIMPTPGGSGGVEGLYALLLGPLMPRAAVVPTLITWRLLGYYLYVGLGGYLSYHHVRTTAERRRAEQALAESSVDRAP